MRVRSLLVLTIIALKVLEAHVCLLLTTLETMVNRREACIGNLEHALAELDIYGKRPRQLFMLKAVSNTVGVTEGKSEVDAIDHYTEELNTLNEQITEQISMVEKKQRPKLGDVRISGSLLTGSALGLHSSSESQRLTVADIGDDGEADTPGKLGCPENPIDLKELVSPVETGNSQASDAASLVNDTVCQSPVVAKGLASCIASTVTGAGSVLKRKAIKNTKQGVKEAQDSVKAAGDAVISVLETNKEDGDADDAGFVTFASLAATHGALQMIQHPEPFVMETETAPDEPRYIFWGNVRKDKEVLQTGRLLSVAVTVVICLSWTFVVTFIVNLTNVDELKAASPSLEETLDANPWIARVLSTISPLLLLIFNSGLLPIVLKAVSQLEFPASDSLLEASVFLKMAVFTVIQTFL